MRVEVRGLMSRTSARTDRRTPTWLEQGARGKRIKPGRRTCCRQAEREIRERKLNAKRRNLMSVFASRLEAAPPRCRALQICFQLMRSTRARQGSVQRRRTSQKTTDPTGVGIVRRCREKPWRHCMWCKMVPSGDGEADWFGGKASIKARKSLHNYQCASMLSRSCDTYSDWRIMDFLALPICLRAQKTLQYHLTARPTRHGRGLSRVLALVSAEAFRPRLLPCAVHTRPAGSSLSAQPASIVRNQDGKIEAQTSSIL